MTPPTILYIVLTLTILGAFVVGGAKAAAIAAFASLILIGMYRRYTQQDEDIKFADAAAKGAAKSKPGKARAKKTEKIAAPPGAKPPTAASMKPKRLRPPTWKTPKR